MSQSNTKAAAIVTNGCHLKGDLTLSGPLHINGTIEGNIHSKSSVVIGASGHVTGEINADQLMVNGVCLGNVRSREVELLEQGTIAGTVRCSGCTIAKGGRLDGKLFLGNANKEHGTRK